MSTSVRLYKFTSSEEPNQKYVLAGSDLPGVFAAFIIQLAIGTVLTIVFLSNYVPIQTEGERIVWLSVSSCFWFIWKRYLAHKSI